MLNFKKFVTSKEFETKYTQSIRFLGFFCSDLKINKSIKSINHHRNKIEKATSCCEISFLKFYSNECHFSKLN